MTEQADASEPWYDAHDSEERREFFDALWTELELFRNAYPHKHWLGSSVDRLREFLEECGDWNGMTWLRIVPGMPGEPTVEIKQRQHDGSDKVVRSLDAKETRELIGWHPAWDT
jgi:hypothetical protein